MVFSQPFKGQEPFNFLKEIQTVLHSIVTKVFVYNQTQIGMHSESILVTSISSLYFFLACMHKVSGTGFTTLLRCSMNHYWCVGHGLKNTTPENSVYTLNLSLLKAMKPHLLAVTGSGSHSLWINRWILYLTLQSWKLYHPLGRVQAMLLKQKVEACIDTNRLCCFGGWRLSIHLSTGHQANTLHWN